MKKSSLTVIVPVFNGADFLREALQSIRRLAQPQEIIVIDDGSTDSTAMVANSCPGVIYVRQENSGPAAARNRGLEIASGNLLAFLDADDIWNEGHPDTGIDYLRCHPDVDLVLGQVEYRFGLNGHDVQTSRQPFHSFQLGAAIVRRGLFSSVGCFNPEMRYGEDVDWFLRARERGAAFAMLPGTALYYRLHAGNQPRIYRNSRVGLLDAFHRSLERRRPAQTPPASARTQPGLISIVIPVFNGEQFVAHAIQSVIRQDYRPIELIVVDDGSIDRTRDLVRRRFPQVRLVEQSHGGAGVARNTGVRASAGEFVAFLDADDTWSPDKLSRQMATLTGSAYEAVFGHAVQFRDGDPEQSEPLPSPIPGTMLIRREAFDRIGFFSEDPNELEGVDWLLRAKEKGLRMMTLPDVVYHRRIHAHNRGVLNRDFDGYVRALKASLDRRRATAPSRPYHAG